MHRRVKKGILIACCLAAAIIACLIGLRIRYLPVLCRLAQHKAETAAVCQIDEAIGQQIQSGAINQDKIILFEKDLNGRVSALKTNMQEVNRLKSMVLGLVRQKLMGLDTSQIGVPLGTLILPEFCAGMGPKVPVRMLAIQQVRSEFLSQFSQAGINQTLQQLHMRVSVKGTVLVLDQVRSFSVSSTVLVAETVIVGEVPHTFS